MTITKMGASVQGVPKLASLRPEAKPKLDNIGISTVHPSNEAVEWAKFQRNKLFNLRQTIGEFYAKVRPCGHYPIKKANNVPIVRGKNKSVFYSQLQTCKSRWACPICSMNINRKNADIVRDILYNAVVVDGNKAIVFALTLPHYKNDNLEKLSKFVVDAFSAITGDVKYKGQHRTRKGVKMITTKGLKQEFGVEGFIKALEVKRSRTFGWHPHIHVAVILNPATETHIQEFAESFIELWTKHVNLTCKKKAKRWCQDYQEIYDINGISDYTTKWDVAKELVESGKKEDGSGIPVFKLIEMFQETGDMEYIDDFLTYAKAFKGKSPITYSTDLKKKFLRGVEEKSDQEACAEEEIEKILLSMSYEMFKQIRSKRQAAHLLNLAQFHPEQVRDFLKEITPTAINVAPEDEPDRYILLAEPYKRQ
jgi:hypothetical protein